MAGFSTVSLVKDEPGHIRRFAQYYSDRGADAVFVYHDGDADPEMFEHIACADLTICDADFWNNVPGGLPGSLEEKQEAIHHHAHARCVSPWMLIVDCDEFVFGDAPVSDFLDRLGDTVESVAIGTAEAVFGPGDDINRAYGATVFRLPIPTTRLGRLLTFVLYGGTAQFLKAGLAGHSQGKQFLRTDREYTRIGIHASWRGDERLTVPAEEATGPGSRLYLGHFDAVCPSHWIEKWRRRIEGDTLAVRMSGRRMKQMVMIADTMRNGSGPMYKLFCGFYAVSRLQFAVLSLFGLAFRRDIFDAEIKPRTP